MLQTEYLLAKIGANTASNGQNSVKLFDQYLQNWAEFEKLLRLDLGKIWQLCEGNPPEVDPLGEGNIESGDSVCRMCR